MHLEFSREFDLSGDVSGEDKAFESVQEGHNYPPQLASW
jgi:hypothetical protein